MKGKINMKNRDVLDLHEALTTIEGRRFSVKFGYFVAKNKVVLKNEYSALDEARKASPEFTEFDTKRATLAADNADKDEQGQPKIENNNFIIIEKFEEFKKALDDLKEEYADAIKEQEQKIKDFEVLLEEEVEYKGPKIDLKDIPEQIEPSVLESLIISDLIIDNEE